MTPAALAAIALAAACAGAQDGPLGAGLEPPPPAERCAVLAFWPRDEWARAACAVQAESAWRPDARNVNADGSDDLGLWQLNSVHGLPDALRLDPLRSTAWARSLWDRRGWTPWYGFAARCGALA